MSNTRTSSSKGEEYYYNQGKKIRIFKRDDLMAIVFNPRSSRENVSLLERSNGDEMSPAEEFKEMQQSNVRIYKISGREATSKRALFERLSSEPNIEKVGEVYVNEYSQPRVITDEIVCKFKRDIRKDKLEWLKNKYGFEIAEKLGFDENAFILRSPSKNVLEVANALVEEGYADYAYPNMIEFVGFREIIAKEIRHGVHPTDPLFNQQWHLENTGQGGGTPGADISAPLAWQITMGNPAIRLAVIDGGTDIAHNDLSVPGKAIDPIDLMVTPPDSNPVGGSHGTQVAGMAVAAANSGCAGCGSAPNCRLIAIKAGDTFAQVLMAKGFQYAADHGADVITCSLGPNGSPWMLTDALRSAIDYATTHGRNGRGCMYTQAIDNTSVAINIDQVASYERTVAVSRTNNRDLYDGAATGPELDLSSPGAGVLTITNTTPTNMCATATVTGTSFAAPLTAGVASLVLSVNPNLSWEEVRQVLLDSADKIDAAANPYIAAPPGFPPGTRNDRYGYGRVNAQRAVELAASGSTRDLYMRDSPTDDGSIPQPNWGFWDSPDIWVRNFDDGGTTHQDTIRGQDNFVYARIWNRGTQPSLPCWVRFLITTFAGTQFRYPSDFKQDTTMTLPGGTPGNVKDSIDFPTPGAYVIGVERMESIPAGGNVVTKVRWDRALIPPALNWHPCLLVEISPHDGPVPTGEYVWDNNNLGQKNITIVNARRGQLLDLPFHFAHPLAIAPFTSLEVSKIKAPEDLELFIEIKEPKSIESIANAAADVSVTPGTPTATGSGSTMANVLSGTTTVSKLPWHITFLHNSRIAITSGNTREGGERLEFTFPAGSSLELGHGKSASIMPEGRQDTSKQSFNIAALEGVSVVALNPSMKLAKIKVPLLQPGFKEASLKLKVPDSAMTGDSYIFDIAERDAKGQLVGGIRVQVNVLD